MNIEVFTSVNAELVEDEEHVDEDKVAYIDVDFDFRFGI